MLTETLFFLALGRAAQTSLFHVKPLMPYSASLDIQFLYSNLRSHCIDSFVLLVWFSGNKKEIIAGVSCGLGFLALLLVINLIR